MRTSLHDKRDHRLQVGLLIALQAVKRRAGSRTCNFFNDSSRTPVPSIHPRFPLLVVRRIAASEYSMSIALLPRHRRGRTSVLVTKSDIFDQLDKARRKTSGARHNTAYFQVPCPCSDSDSTSRIRVDWPASFWVLKLVRHHRRST
uniref:Uncharacterized protein n=1 Tax=Mycena chlorophos TaxID=658473 RepID=A0ABQ0M879_MYCCL|nr:predicted protein [Mycena chlorophos]